MPIYSFMCVHRRPPLKPRAKALGKERHHLKVTIVIVIFCMMLPGRVYYCGLLGLYFGVFSDIQLKDALMRCGSSGISRDRPWAITISSIR